PADQEVVLADVDGLGPTGCQRHVIAPGRIEQAAAQARRDAVGAVVAQVDARAAFHVALPQGDAGHVGGHAGIGAQGADQLVVAGHVDRHAESARFGDLLVRAALEEHRLDVRGEVLVDFIAAHEAGSDALVGTLVEVDRRVVVHIAAVFVTAAVPDVVGIRASRPRDHPDLGHTLIIDKRAILIDTEAPRIRRAGTTALRRVEPHRAGGVVALALVQRLVLAPGQPADRVAAAVVTEAATDHQIGVAADAVKAGIARRIGVAGLLV